MNRINCLICLTSKNVTKQQKTFDFHQNKQLNLAGSDWIKSQCQTCRNSSTPEYISASIVRNMSNWPWKVKPTVCTISTIVTAVLTKQLTIHSAKSQEMHTTQYMQCTDIRQK